MPRASKVGIAACVAGLALAAAVQSTGPSLRPPLYDGVVTVDPYKYLQPVGTQAGGPQAATGTVPAVNDISPAIALGTPEQPPQAQLIAGPGALVLPTGTTSVVVTITPVPPAVQPASGAIDGNVYRVSVLNQAGVAVSPLPGKQVTLALRDPGQYDLVTIALLAGGGWQPLPTVSAAVGGTYETTGLTAFGDFALVGSGSTGTSGSGSAPSPFAIVTIAALVFALSVFAITFLRDRVGKGRRPG
jgi:hypothetical protein